MDEPKCGIIYELPKYTFDSSEGTIVVVKFKNGQVNVYSGPVDLKNDYFHKTILSKINSIFKSQNYFPESVICWKAILVEEQ